jgi:two-component system cell cycle sensor histidine kinase PleC
MPGLKHRLFQSIPLSRLFAAGSVALPGLVLLIALLLANQTVQNGITNKAVIHEAGMHTRLQRVFSLLQDGETGQRGYLITGQERFLRPYDNSQHHIAREMAALVDLSGDDAAEQRSMRHLQSLTNAKMAELARTVTMRRAGQATEAAAAVSGGRGLALMDEIRGVTARIQAIQANELKTQMALREAGYRRTSWFVGVLLAALVVFIAFSAVSALVNYRARERVLIEVRQLTEQLSAEKVRLLQTVNELNAARHIAVEANKAKSEFLASMSHELRTPLNAILGFSEIIKEETFGPVGLHKYVDYAADVHSSGRHLLDLINDILDLSKIDAGKVELHEEELSLAHVMDDSLSLVRERALRGGVALVEEKPAGALPSIWADRRLLKQILLNLLSNAINFTPAGGTVTIGLFADASGIGFTVRDTGIGMTDEDVKIAMSPYGQIDSRVSRKHKGTGLGLPISLSLAKLHGGDLIVQSAPDQGTTMTLRMPLSRRRAPPAGRQAA